MPWPSQGSELRPGDCSPRHNLLQLKKPDLRVKLFRQIKAQVRAKREASVKQLVFEQTKVRIRDCWLKRMSPSYWHVWKLFQAKAFILSVVRSVVMSYRQLGIAADPTGGSGSCPGHSKRSERRLPLRLYPDDAALQCHAWLLLLVFCYVVVLFPLQMAFGPTFSREEQRSLTASNCAVLSYLSMDVCARFFTVVRQDGLVVDSLRALASRYIRSYFLLDLLGSLPFEYFVDIPQQTAQNVLLMVRVCRVFSAVFSK